MHSANLVGRDPLSHQHNSPTVSSEHKINGSIKIQESDNEKNKNQNKEKKSKKVWTVWTVSTVISEIRVGADVLA